MTDRFCRLRRSGIQFSPYSTIGQRDSGCEATTCEAANGHLFFLSEDGLKYVVKAGPEFEIVERNPLDELCISSPAIVGDKLLIRTAPKLYRLTKGVTSLPGS